MVPKTVVSFWAAYALASEAPRPRVAPMMSMLGISADRMGIREESGGVVYDLEERNGGSGR